MADTLGAAPVWGTPERLRPALPGDRDADVVIVGAGYTGLWTAYYLLSADPALRVRDPRQGVRRVRGVRPQRRLVLGASSRFR